MKKLTVLMMLLGLIFISAGDVMAVGDMQVQVYKDRHLGGYWWLLGKDDVSRDVLGDGMSENIESVEVGKGVKVTLYDKEYQQGYKIVLYPGVYPSLNMNDNDNPWNNEAKSLKVEQLSDPNLPLIKLTYDNINHSDGGYGGDGSNFTQMIGLDGTDEFKADYCLLLDNNVISADIPKAYKVTFYQDSGYGGNHNSVPISGRTVNMADIGLGFKVSSIKIE